MGEWIGAAEAAQRLGVKPATLYAYVSRGVLRRRGADGRSSLFDPAEIAGLADRSRPRRPAATAGMVIESAMAATDRLRLHLDPPAVAAAGRSIIARCATAGRRRGSRPVSTGRRLPARGP